MVSRILIFLDEEFVCWLISALRLGQSEARDLQNDTAI